MSQRNYLLCVPRPSSGQDPNTAIVVSSALPDHIPPNHVLVKVDKFGFSANNVTYQALGEHPHFRYFDFHAVPENSQAEGNGASGSCAKTHGLIPVWGFGLILKSTHPKIQEGERIYGYLAPAQYLLLAVSPNDVNKFAFYVPRPHLPPGKSNLPYNQILRCSTDPHYTPTPLAEDLTMLYRPLFWTSYWCEDWLSSSQYKGGNIFAILISSASSKTAFCLAYLIGKRIKQGGLNASTKIIGLTSKRNTEFTKGLNLYNEVLDYDSFTNASSLQSNQGSRFIYVDVAGNSGLNERIKAHFASPYTGNVIATVALGVTNLSPSAQASEYDWDFNRTFDMSSSPVVSGTSPFWPKVEHFFMPEWLAVRRHQLPVQDIFEGQNRAWKGLMEDCVNWVELERVSGPEKVKDAYLRVAKEGLGPRKGLVWSMWDEIAVPVKARL
ncbi:hypothetical protein CVT24_010698 [Panaeolus cyanescens]|uniref:DUF2855 family protein n=1 Tax=Panaeolus cyanescens TaxID=181874 RepID=A0A409YVX8_9AGAR|nr:hypothetical protein CVT24_010698 [Panaeolus cyanescens]